MAGKKSAQPEVVEQEKPVAVDVTAAAILEMKRSVEDAAKESAGKSAEVSNS